MIRPVLASRGSISGMVAVAGGSPKWWLAGGAPTPIAVYQPKGSTSLAASYVNLITPGTFDAAPGVAPTFNAATGWTFNGSTQYLRTGITFTRSYTVLISYNLPTLPFGSGVACGANVGGGASQFSIQPKLVGDAYFINSGSTITSPYVASGVLGIAGNAAYKSGTSVGTFTFAFNLSFPELYIGARNNDGSPLDFFNQQIRAVAVYSSTLTAGMVAALSAAMAAL